MPVWTTTLPANVAVRILGKTKGRIVYTIYNDSSYDVYRAFSPSVATSGSNKGAKVPKSGGSIEDQFHKGDVYLITATACEVTIEDVLTGEQE